MTGPVPPFRRRLRSAVWPAVRFALLCALAFLVAVALSLRAHGFAPLPRTGIALAVLALPPALVGGVAAWAFDVVLPRAGRIARGIQMGFTLSLVGPAASAAVFGLVYRVAYPDAFADFWTKAGLHETIWTAISTTYLYLIAGPKLYLPWTPVAVLALLVAYAFRRPRYWDPTLRRAGNPAKQRASDHDSTKSR
jgi:hypothetical protein